MACECMKPELDLFSNAPLQTSTEQGQWIEYHPLATLEQTGIIELNIDGAGDEHLDLYNTYCYVEAKLVQQDGTPLPEDAPAAPVNLMMHSLFNQVDVSLNEKPVTPSKNTYPYRAYLETLLSCGQEAKASQLTMGLWYKDTAGHMDSVKGTDNKGFLR